MTKPPRQIDLFLPPPNERKATLGDGEEIPPGPYRIGKLFDATHERYTRPYTIVAGDGRTIAGHIDNLAVAVLLTDLLNAQPAPTETT